MKTIYTIIICLAMATACKAPAKTAADSGNNSASATGTKSLTVVSFNSICCGVRSDEFLKNFYEAFKKDNKVNLSATKATGCGKEGEYKVMFSTGNLSAEMARKFSNELRSLVETETRTNTGNQAGTVNVEVVDAVDVSFCRGGEKVF